MKYALVDFIMTVTVPQNMRTLLGFNSLSIGGEGSYLDSISIEQRNNTWETEGDDTGSWIHKKSFDRVGTAAVSLNVVSPQVILLTRLLNLYYNSEVEDEGVTITVSNARGEVVATCIDCMLSKPPAINIQSSPGTREWSFTCGKVSFA